MRVIINGQPEELPDELTVRDLLERYGLGRAPAAIEINQELVPRHEHAERILMEDDKVEIVTLVGGG